MGNELAVTEKGLLRIEEARRLLAECVSVDDLKAIRDKAKATAAYYRERGAALEAQNDAAEIRLRAERRLGELLEDMPKNQGGDPRKRNEQPPALGEIGITRIQSSMWQRIASLAEEEFEDRIAEAKENGLELTTTRMLKGAVLARVPAEEPKPGDSAPRTTRERVLEAVIAVREAKDHRDEWWSRLRDLRDLLVAVPEPKTEAGTQKVWEAMEQLEEASEFEDEEYHRAWERFRNAAYAWMVESAGGRGQLRAMFREGKGVHRTAEVKK